MDWAARQCVKSASSGARAAISGRAVYRPPQARRLPTQHWHKARRTARWPAQPWQPSQPNRSRSGGSGRAKRLVFLALLKGQGSTTTRRPSARRCGRSSQRPPRPAAALPRRAEPSDVGATKQGCRVENCRKPPGRSTRRASCNAAAWSGMSIRDMNAVANSKLSDLNGRSMPSPAQYVMPSGSPCSPS
jgi:hypothetical protein